MPNIEIDYTAVSGLLEPDNGAANGAAKDALPANSGLIPTSDGLVLLEIQGTLNLPTKITSEHEIVDIEQEESDISKAIRVGKLEIEGSIATLYIGTSQRLLGTVEKINPPFGLLKFPTRANDENRAPDAASGFESGHGSVSGSLDEKVQMVNIIEKKVVFRQRPLPIM